MKIRQFAVIASIALLTLNGCASLSGQNNKSATVRVTATGYGATGHFEGYSAGQRRLMAMRASKLDAYRSLAEQVYGVRVKGNTTVGAMVAQNDGYRIYLDAYLRGARVVSVTPMAEGNYETEVEIEMPADFAQRVAASAATSSEGAARSMAYNSYYYAD